MKAMFELIGQASEWLWLAPWWVGLPVCIMMATCILLVIAMVNRLIERSFGEGGQ